MMKQIATIFAIGLLLSEPSSADEFCDSLLRVVDDAGSGFAHVRGKKESDMPRYDNGLTLPGASEYLVVVGGVASPQSSCAVTPNPEGAKTWRYMCEFPDPQRQKDAQTEQEIEAHLDACLIHLQKKARKFIDSSWPYSATTTRSRIQFGPGYDGGVLRYYLAIDQKAL